MGLSNPLPGWESPAAFEGAVEEARTELAAEMRVLRLSPREEEEVLVFGRQEGVDEHSVLGPGYRAWKQASQRKRRRLWESMFGA